MVMAHKGHLNKVVKSFRKELKGKTQTAFLAHRELLIDLLSCYSINHYIVIWILH